MGNIDRVKRFNKVNIEISNICNLQCSFCPEVIRDKQLMQPEFFRHIISQVGPLTDQVCLHLMGDPLVHPKLEEFVQICREAEVKIFLVTNGVLLRKNIALTLFDPTIRQVCFSLHSFRDNFGDKDPTQYLNRIFEFTDQALALRPDLYINYRLWNLQAAQGDGIQNRELLERILARYPSETDIIAWMKTDVRIRKGRRLTGRLYMHFDTEFTWPDLNLPLLGETGTCYGLSNHFGILVDGTVVPCCLDKEAAIPLGNLKNQEVLAILGSDRAQAMLSGFKKHQLIEPLCQRCQYNERFS